MTFILRPYQESSVQSALDFFADTKGVITHTDRGMLIEPTGSGKSIITANIAHQLKSGVLVLQPSKELLEQNYAKFKAYGGEASVFSASMKTKEVGDVTFATIGSLKDKQELFAHVKYVLIDECHLVPPTDSMFTRFFGKMNVQVIGLTATPFRLKNFRDPHTGIPYSQINLLNRMRPLFFNKFLHVTQIKELYDQGFLSPIKYIPLVWRNDGLVVNTTGAEFTEESIERVLLEQEVITRIPGIVKESIEKGRKHRIVFVSSVADAEYLASIVPNSKAVSALTKPQEREDILTRFKAGEIQTVFNVGVLTIGFDFPALDTIIIARPTMSLSLYMQMIGRGIRLADGKQDCAVVDMCGNYNRFGEIETIEYKQLPYGQKLWVLMNKGQVLSNVKLKP